MARLDELCDINPPKPRLQGVDDRTEVLFVPMAAVDEVSGTIANPEQSTVGAVGRKSYRSFTSGDVLFAKITPCMENGKSAVVPVIPTGYGFGSTEFHVLRPKPGTNPQLIWHLIRQQSFRDQAARHFTGSVGQLRVPASFLQSFEVMVPSGTVVQSELADLLDTATGRALGASAHLAACRRAIVRFHQAVLAAACSGRLTADWRDGNPEDNAANLVEAVRSRRPDKYRDASVRDDLDLPDVPDSWVWTNLRYLLSPDEAFCYGVVQPGENDPNGVYLVRAGDLEAGHVDMSALRRVSRHINNRYRRSQLHGGEVLVTVVGAGIGEAAIAQAECAGFNIARAVAKLPIREFEARYVQLWLSTTRAVAWMKRDSREVARPTLNLEQLQTLPVPLPPLAEQQEIVHRVERLFALADGIVCRVDLAAHRVQTTQQAVLDKAFRGKLIGTAGAS